MSLPKPDESKDSMRSGWGASGVSSLFHMYPCETTTVVDKKAFVTTTSGNQEGARELHRLL